MKKSISFEKDTPPKQPENLRIMRELYGKPGPNSKLVSIEQWEERFRRKEVFRHPGDGC